MAHPERVYDWIRDHDLVIPELLLVPLFTSTNVPFGTLWLEADTPNHFCRRDAELAVGLGNFIEMAWGLVQSQKN